MVMGEMRPAQASDLNWIYRMGIVKLTKIQSNDPQDIVIASDQERDTMSTSLGCLPAT